MTLSTLRGKFQEKRQRITPDIFCRQGKAAIDNVSNSIAAFPAVGRIVSLSAGVWQLWCFTQIQIDRFDGNEVFELLSLVNCSSNIGIAAVVLATTIVQPQIGIPLALKLGLAGAALKVGASAALEGVDHSGDYSRLARDAGTGFASAVAAATLGPTQLINAFKIGGAAAKEAVSSSLTQIAGQGAKTALKEGGAEALERGLKEATQKVLESGASSEVFQALAERAVGVAIQGKSREALVGQLAQALEGNFQKGLANAVVRFAERQAFNTGSAAAGGAAEGIVEAGFEWKTNLTFEENLSAVATKVAQNTEASALGAAVGSGVAGAAVGRARVVATKPVEAARKAAEETAKQKRQGQQKEAEQKEQEKKKS